MRTLDRRSLFEDRRGASLAEYVLVLGLAGVVGMLAWPKLGVAVNHQAERQAECGLLNADEGCDGALSSGGSKAVPSPPPSLPKLPPSLSPSAFADPEPAFAAIANTGLAHELAHVVQQAGGVQVDP
jgi:hypothetical protein